MKKSVRRLKQKVGEILVPGNQAPWPEVRDRLNRLLRGWLPTGRSTIISITAFDVSWFVATKCNRKAPAASALKWCSANAACCDYATFILARRR